MFKLNLNFSGLARLGILLFMCLRAHASSYDYSPLYGSESDESPAGRVALVVDYVVSGASVITKGAPAITATGTGFNVGLEVDAPTKSPNGEWILGAYYTQQNLQLSPNAKPEVDTFQSIEIPVSWGIFLGPHFLLSIGGMFKYDLDRIQRKSDGVTTSLSHKEFGLGITQYNAMGGVRFFLRAGRKTKILADFKYAYGLADRALGTSDHWRERVQPTRVLEFCFRFIGLPKPCATVTRLNCKQR